MLDVPLIGALDIRVYDTPVPLPSRTTQSLFAYLILTAGTHRRREKLAGTFWPDTTVVRACACVQDVLSGLRNVFSSESKQDDIDSDEIQRGFNAAPLGRVVLVIRGLSPFATRPLRCSSVTGNLVVFLLKDRSLARLVLRR